MDKSRVEDEDEKIMESRKVQVSAGGSFFIVLPKEWSKKLGLKRGGRVNVFMEEDGSVRLLPAEVTREYTRIATLNVDEQTNPKSVDLFLKANYMGGCNIVDIKSKKRIDPNLKKAIKASVSELIGVETAEETSDRLSLRAIVDPTGFPLENLFKRVCNLSISMFTDTVKAFRERDLELANDVIERAGEAMKLYRLMVRQVMLAHADRVIAKNLGIDRTTECITLGIVARDVSRLVYHISSMASQVREILKSGITYNEKVNDLLFRLFDAALDMVQNTFKAFMERNTQLASEVMERMKTIRELDELITKEAFETVKDVQSAIRLTAVVREVRRVAGHAVAVADDAIFNETVHHY
ncbi:hypothetical protein DRO26_01420 [Candidatus Bathyarchaeota archaeon]|nr:MAG: hypothetical protein DRO26_01420 [Candidatus Bathyarchaeota archaeon]